MKTLHLAAAISLSVLCQMSPASTHDEPQDETSLPATGAAVQVAKRKMPELLQILRKPTGVVGDFAVRVRLSEGTVTEWVWLSPVSVIDGRLAGKISNSPQKLPSLKAGSEVRVALSELVDWSYFDAEKGKRFGHFTTCALLRRQPPDIRQMAIASLMLQCDA